MIILTTYINIVKGKNIDYSDLIKSKNNIKLDSDEIKLLNDVYLKYCVQYWNILNKFPKIPFPFI